MTDRVRAAAGRLNRQKWFARSQVFNQAEILVREQSSFDACWNELRSRGELERMCYGKYRYNAHRAPTAGGVKRKIHRAMHVKRAFCAPDIAKLTDAEISYVHGTIRRLVKDGWLEFTGRRNYFMFFRVRNADKFYQEFIKG